MEASVFFQKCNEIIEQQNAKVDRISIFGDESPLTTVQESDELLLGGESSLTMMQESDELLLGTEMLDSQESTNKPLCAETANNQISNKYFVKEISDRIIDANSIPEINVDKYIMEFTDSEFTPLENMIINALHSFNYEFVQGNTVSELIMNSLERVYNTKFQDNIFAEYVFCVDLFNIKMDYIDFSSIEKFLTESIISSIGFRKEKFNYLMFQVFQKYSVEEWFQPDIFLKLVTEDNAGILLDAMKTGTKLECILKYAVDDLIIQDALHLIIADKFNAETFEQAMENGTVNEYTKQLLNNDTSSLITKISARADFADINEVISKNSIPDDILSRFADSEFLPDILSLYIRGVFSNDLIDDCIQGRSQALSRILLSAISSDKFTIETYEEIKDIFLTTVIVHLRELGISEDNVRMVYSQVPEKCLRAAQHLVTALATQSITKTDYRQYLLMYSLPFVIAFTNLVDKRFSVKPVSFNAFWLMYFASKLQTSLTGRQITLDVDDFRVNCGSMLIVSKQSTVEISVEEIILDCKSVITKINPLINTCDTVTVESGAQLVVYLVKNPVNISVTSHRLIGPLEYWAAGDSTKANTFTDVLQAPLKEFITQNNINKSVKELCNNSLKTLAAIDRQTIYFESVWSKEFHPIVKTKNCMVYLNVIYLAKSFSPTNNSQMLFCMLHIILKLLLKERFSSSSSKMLLAADCSVIIRDGNESTQITVKEYIEHFEKNLEHLLSRSVTLSCNDSIVINVK